jgi:hypothetical protein
VAVEKVQPVRGGTDAGAEGEGRLPVRHEREGLPDQGAGRETGPGDRDIQGPQERAPDPREEALDRRLEESFRSRRHFPEEIGDDEASERIHEFLRGYEDGDLLGGWVIFHDWIDADGGHHIGTNVSPDLDWPRCLGIVDAGGMRLRRAYMSEEDSED